MISRKKIIYILNIFTIFLFQSLKAATVLDPHSLSIHTVEKKFAIPHGLLSAISKVESGRYHEKHRRVISWPWVIHAEGRGHFFNNKHEAIKAVQNLTNKGVKNIDVGLMQVNLFYHGKAFASLDHAFDPRTNIEYAAKYLTSLKKEHATWSKAVAHYHSASPVHHIPYRQKVYKMWQEEQKNSFRSWEDLSQARSGQSGGDTWFRSPNFRIIRLRPGTRVNTTSPAPMRVNRANIQDKPFSNLGKQAKLLRLKRISTSNISKATHLQNRFRYIKTRKQPQ